MRGSDSPVRPSLGRVSAATAAAITTATPATATVKQSANAACQTLSTGDIVITKVFFQEEADRSPQKVLHSSSAQTTNK